MWWLYTHDCTGMRWTLLTSTPAATPGPGEAITIPVELREAGNGFFQMGHHIGLRFTTQSKFGPQTINTNKGGTMLRIVSIMRSKPWSCRYEEPTELQLVQQ